MDAIVKTKNQEKAEIPLDQKTDTKTDIKTSQSSVSTSEVQKPSSQFKIRQATAADEAPLLKLICVPMTTKGVTISFQREPSYFNASQVIYQVNDHCVVEDIATQKLVACYSNGHRPCYINGEIQPMRYASDLRIDRDYRGTTLMKEMGLHMHKTMQNPDFNHMIIFNDNLAARKAVQTGKVGIPNYYDECEVETLTLTAIRKNKVKDKLLSASEDHGYLSNIQIKTAEHNDIEAMNQFVQCMAKFYNFIPAYDFHDLLNDSKYYQGLSLSDFQLYYLNDQLIGMFGLWSQSSFKQTKILDYGWTVDVIRPIYNLWANLRGTMKLPKKGDSIKYHALHSLLCKPSYLALHDLMLNDALKLSKSRGVGCVSYTLSHRDPRQRLNQYYRGELLTGVHGFMCPSRDPRPDIDAQRIAYLEVGRI